MNEEEIENRMNSIIQLFSYLSEKDRFIQDYEKKFGKRLINGTFLSLDHESKMISKLKVNHFFFLRVLGKKKKKFNFFSSFIFILIDYCWNIRGFKT